MKEQCQHCGHTGTDVATRPEYLGGHDYIEMTLCIDREACWHRWDRQHGYRLSLTAA